MQAQRYEGASTAYGPNELEAFISQFRRLVQDMENEGLLTGYMS